MATYVWVLADENSCNSNPCQNGAKCYDTMNGFTCGPCPTGYTGRYCERRMYNQVCTWINYNIMY